MCTQTHTHIEEIMFNFWKKKEDVHISELTKIDVTPEIVIPEATRKELFDEAVIEVTTKKIEVLILEGLKDLCLAEHRAQYDEAFTYIGGTTVDNNKVPLQVFRKKFPLVHVKYGIDDYYYMQEPELSVELIAEHLTNSYLQTLKL